MARNLEKQEKEQEKEQREDALDQLGRPPHGHHVHQFRHSRGTTVLWTLCVVIVLFGIFAIIGALTTPSTPGNSAGDGVAGGAIIIGFGLIFGFWAWNRKPITPGASVRYASQPFTRTSAQLVHSAVTGSAATGSPPVPASTVIPRPLDASDARWSTPAIPSYRGRHHVKDPRKQTAVFGVLFAISVIALVSGIGLSQRSSFTQHHGVSVRALVVSYDNHQSCGRSSCSETFAANVALATSVKGHSSTVVHGNGYFPDAQGDTITVLVDPHDPGYGELPGNALDASGTWIVFLVIAVVVGLLFMSALLRLFHYYAGILPGRHLPGR